MTHYSHKSDFEREILTFIKKDFKPNFGLLGDKFKKNPLWQKLKDTGTQLWLDTGSISDAQELWTQEFTALTTNNTLLNRQVQTGRYDSLIAEAAEMLDSFGLNQKDMMLEIAFILNAYHGLSLVETFDCYVSVEEHTDLANDLDGAIDYARRFYAICPERFFVKIPFTPAGVLATRKVSAEGIPVNQTLGFSARQNYLMARITKPKFVNVFLGRLNSFVKDNDLGDGSFVGEKAVLASQTVVSELRINNLSPSRQIGASLRSPDQIDSLAGLDVMTIPPKVAQQFLQLDLKPENISDKTKMDYIPGLNEGIDPKASRLDTLWDIEPEYVDCVEQLEKENLDNYTANDLITFFQEYGYGDIFYRFSDSQINTSMEEGKIPKLNNWTQLLADKSIGLDTLMNLAGLNSFKADQKAMDDRVKSVLTKAAKI